MDKTTFTLTASQITLLQQAATLLAKASLLLQQISSDTRAKLILDMPANTPPDQRWYWTQEWQAREREANAALASGNYEVFDTVEALLADLSQPV